MKLRTTLSLAVALVAVVFVTTDVFATPPGLRMKAIGTYATGIFDDSAAEIVAFRDATIPLETARGWLDQRDVGEPEETALVQVPLWRCPYSFKGADYEALVDGSTGAVLASFTWFFALGYGARLLAPLFARPLAWRILDVAIALIMAGLAVMLLASLNSQ